MIDPRDSQSVLDALGQKPLDAVGNAVRDTRLDLREYRSTLPAMAARHSQRGILNWIHDQFFAHLRGQFEAAVTDSTVVDREPHREIFVGHTFRFRFKKHSASDMVSSFPTPGFLDFAMQDPPQLIQEIRLIGGYRWDPDTREIGAAVLSARDGRDNVLWVIELAEGAAGEALHFAPRAPQPDLPGLPKIVETFEVKEAESGRE